MVFMKSHKALAVFVALALSFNNVNFVYAAKNNTVATAKTDTVDGDLFSGMTTDEQSEAAGEYFSEIVKFINDNYIGDSVSTQKLLQAAIKGMAGELDVYSDYLTDEEYEAVKQAESGKYYSLGVDCVFSEDDYPTVAAINEESQASALGLSVNDKITAINGVSTYGIQSGEYTTLTTSAEAADVKLTYTHKKKLDVIKVPMLFFKVKSVERIDMAQTVNKNVRGGYENKSVAGIKISAFSAGTADEFKAMVRQVKNEGATRLILDLRGNTGGYVDQAIEVCKQIVPSGIIVTAVNKKGTQVKYMSTLYAQPFEKMVVLVDGMTASSAEIVASALQDSGAATVVGEKTYGKGVMQSVTDFNELGVLKMTTYEYFTRTGKKVNGVGVTPDVAVGKVLFVSEEDDLESEKVKAAFELLGLQTGNSQQMMRSVGRFQALNGLDITYELDQKTITAINVKIYTDMLTNDRTLKTGYLNIIS
jgi:carboxyl-terminal processing protease